MKLVIHKILALAGLLLVLSFVPQASWANVCPGATVTSTGVSFGNYDPISGAAVTSSGTITMTCGGNTATPIISIQLSTGSGTFAQRFMKDTTTGTNDLNYNLYVDATYASTSIWGDGTSSTLDPGGTTSGHAGSNSLVLTVYGKIPANQDAYAGCTVTGCSYSDTVNITVNF